MHNKNNEMSKASIGKSGLTQTQTYSSTQDYGSSYSTGYSSGATQSSVGKGALVSPHRASPKLAFKVDGLEFWGSSHSNLDDVSFTDKDLLVNGYGTTFVPKPFIKSAPSWMDLSSMNTSGTINQLLLDWKDFSPPPRSADISFWERIIMQAKANGISRIICCCGAGLGRTGTALASFALASGYIEEPEQAIKEIRRVYNRQAIETKGQELYIWSLIYELQEEADGEDDDVELEFQSKATSNALSRSLDFEDSGEAWNNWTKNNRTTK